MLGLLKPIAGALIPGLLATGTAFAAESCELDFEVVAERAIGTVASGERLQGRVAFEVQSSWQQDRETVSYAAKGTMRLVVPERGAVSADVRVVHVIRTPYTADYISIDASKAAGNLGGEKSYADPMLLTLYAAPGALASSDLPRSASDWNVLSKRRVFQVHTPTPMQIFIGLVENLSGRCE